MNYRLAAIVVPLIVVVALIATGAFLVLTRDEATADVPIQGVDRASLQAQGIALKEPRGRPLITADEARRKATQGAAVREIVLASLEEQGRGRRDVWVINYDPATVGDPPSSGPYIPGASGTPNYTNAYALDFIDAVTGEFVSGVQEDIVE